MENRDVQNKNFIKKQIIKSVRVGVITLLAFLVVVAPATRGWQWHTDKEITIRECKNVILNLELLSIEAFGFNEPIVEKTRTSGISEAMEQKVRNYAGVSGEIWLIGFDEYKGEVKSLAYQNRNFLVLYTKDKDNNPNWKIYYLFHK